MGEGPLQFTKVMVLMREKGWSSSSHHKRLFPKVQVRLNWCRKSHLVQHPVVSAEESQSSSPPRGPPALTCLSLPQLSSSSPPSSSSVLPLFPLPLCFSEDKQCAGPHLPQTSSALRAGSVLHARFHLLQYKLHRRCSTHMLQKWREVDELCGTQGVVSW